MCRILLTGQRLRTTVIQKTHSHTCVKLFDLHLRLPHYDAAVRLTPERYHGSSQGDLGGLHDRTLLVRLQHLHKHTTHNTSGRANQCSQYFGKQRSSSPPDDF